MCKYFCIGFINVMFKCKSLKDFTNLFSLNNFKKNDEVNLKYLVKLNRCINIDMAIVETTKNINMYPQLDNTMK